MEVCVCVCVSVCVVCCASTVWYNMLSFVVRRLLDPAVVVSPRGDMYRTRSTYLSKHRHKKHINTHQHNTKQRTHEAHTYIHCIHPSIHPIHIHPHTPRPARSSPIQHTSVHNTSVTAQERCVAWRGVAWRGVATYLPVSVHYILCMRQHPSLAPVVHPPTHRDMTRHHISTTSHARSSCAQTCLLTLVGHALASQWRTCVMCGV